jgi:DNA repair photolyase
VIGANREVYTTPFGITSQYAFCGLPLRLDTYKGCAFRCLYCFARNRGGFRAPDDVTPADPNTIERTLARALSKGSSAPGLVAEFLRHRVPIHLGGMSDPFQPAERHFRVTARTLAAVRRWDYPIVISTRGSLASEAPYFSALQALRAVVVQFSFSSTNDGAARLTEPHTTGPSVLLGAMEHLASRGIPVTVRWQPYIPGVSEKPDVFVNRVSAAGARHVSLEHLKIPVETGGQLWRQMRERTGRDFRAEYRAAGAQRGGREMLLPSDIKLGTILATRAAAHRTGMTFGAADNEFQYLSDTSCCCSGVDQFPGFEHFFRHQIAYAVRESAGRDIRYATLAAEWSPRAKLDRFLNSHSRIDGGVALRTHIKYHWCNPVGGLSPQSFYGVTLVGGNTERYPTFSWLPAGKALWADVACEMRQR